MGFSNACLLIECRSRRRSRLPGHVADIPASIAGIFLPNVAGLHSSDKLGHALGKKEWLCLWILPLQVGHIPLRRTKRRTVFEQGSGPVLSYLHLGTSRAFRLLLHTFRLFPWFLDERNWLVHDWRIVRMCWWRADGAGCWTPGGRGALWGVKRCCCCSWCGFTTTPAKCTFSPRRVPQVNCKHLNVLLVRFIVTAKWNLPTSPPVWDLGRGSACV